jgi:hypothetical protein
MFAILPIPFKVLLAAFVPVFHKPEIPPRLLGAEPILVVYYKDTTENFGGEERGV